MASCAKDVGTAVFDLAPKCAVASDFSFSVIKDAPTPRQIVRICSSPQCSQAIATIRKAVPTECNVSSGDQAIQLYQEVLNPIAAVCSKGSIVATQVPSSSTASDETAAPPVCGKPFSDAAFNTVQCMADSDYSFYVIKALPTEEQISKLCASSNCAAALAALKKAAPSECTTGGVRGDAFQLYKAILNPIDAACAKPSSASQASATKEPETGTTSLPSSSSPNATTTSVPAPAPTSGAAAKNSLAKTLALALVASLAVLQAR